MVQICTIKMKMTKSSEAGANMHTWELSEYLKSRIKSLPKFYGSCITPK